MLHNGPPLTTQAEACAICSSPTHPMQSCPSGAAFPEFLSEQVHAMNTFQKPGNNPYSNTYNPGWARHPNFSWAKGPQQGGPSKNPPLQPYHQAGNQQPQ